MVECYSFGAETFARLRNIFRCTPIWLMGVQYGVSYFAGFTASKTVAWCMVWALALGACFIVRPRDVDEMALTDPS